MLFQVSAVDPDDGQNKHILYGLNAGSNENSTFWIDPLSGIIVTRNPVVDREGIPFYSLIVEAFDQVNVYFIICFIFKFEQCFLCQCLWILF